MTSLAEAAVDYARQGLEIFPLNGDKTPATAHGFLDASSNPEQVASWWQMNPGALIGCRVPPDIIILDLDPRHGGVDTMRQLVERNGKLPKTRRHGSGRGDGGRHIWLQRPDGKLTTRDLPGVDLLHHDLRYTILPPSPHPATGLPYFWGEDAPVAGCPPWLADLLRKPEQQPAPSLGRIPGDHAGADGQSPIERYKDEHTIAELLVEADWTQVGDGKWRHPTATAAMSATERDGRLYVYTDTPGLPVTEHGDPQGLDVFDLYAWIEHGGDFDTALKAIMPDRRKIDPATGEIVTPTRKHPAAGRRLKLTQASTIPMRPVRWLWADRIPQGAISLLGGREGIGKSTYAYRLVADITRGRLPGVYYGIPKKVFIAATEDSWEHTIGPRLAAADADRTLVYRIEVQLETTGAGILTLPQDVPALTDAVNEHQAGLVLLDPLLSRLDANLDSHKDGEVRIALEPITQLADETQCAVIGLIHVNKSATTDPLTMLMGSRAFAAVARAVLFVMVQPETDGKVRLLGQAKNNLGRLDLPTLAFEILNTKAGDVAGEEIWTGAIHDLGESDVDIITALDMAASQAGSSGATEDALAWLVDYLTEKGGRASAADCKSAGASAGHEKRTIERAKKKGKIEHETSGFPRTSYWVMPSKASGANSLGRHEVGATGATESKNASHACHANSPTPRANGATVPDDL